MASDQLKIVLDPNGIDQIAAIIAHLKQRNDELTAALTAVQAVSTQQMEEIRRLKFGWTAGPVGVGSAVSRL